ncbi:hypothetical protein VTK26DRAFT_2697 [Humicola hyalothermophila]
MNKPRDVDKGPALPYGLMGDKEFPAANAPRDSDRPRLGQPGPFEDAPATGRLRQRPNLALLHALRAFLLSNLRWLLANHPARLRETLLRRRRRNIIITPGRGGCGGVGSARRTAWAGARAAAGHGNEGESGGGDGDGGGERAGDAEEGDQDPERGWSWWGESSPRGYQARGADGEGWRRLVEGGGGGVEMSGGERERWERERERAQESSSSSCRERMATTITTLPGHVLRYVEAGGHAEWLLPVGWRPGVTGAKLRRLLDEFVEDGLVPPGVVGPGLGGDVGDAGDGA